VKKTNCLLLFFAITIFLNLLFPAGVFTENEIRTITITAAVDRELLQTLGSEKIKKQLKNDIAFVSSVFKEEFRISFLLEKIEPWDYPCNRREINGGEAFADLENIRKKSASDILLGFSDKETFLCTEIDDKQEPSKDCPENMYKKPVRGMGHFLGNSAFLILNYRTQYTALHEICHIFGAEHVSDPHSIMFVYTLDTKKIDEKNKSIIKNNRMRKF